MAVLRSGIKAALIGFVVVCLLQFLRILIPFYCFSVFIVGVLAAYFYLRDHPVVSLPHMLFAGIIASLLTIGGAWLSTVLLDALSGLNRWVGIDPMDLFMPTRLLFAAVFGIAGALIGAAWLLPKEKLQTQAPELGPDQKGKRNRLHPVWLVLLMLLGGASLSMLIIGGIAFIVSGNTSGNLNAMSINDVKLILPFTFISGAIAGLFIYAGWNIAALKPASENRILARLLLIVGISLFAWVCVFSALIAITINMM